MLKGAIVGAAEGGFVAGDEGEGLAVIGKPLKNPGETVVVGGVGEFFVDRVASAGEFVGEDESQPSGGSYDEGLAVVGRGGHVRSFDGGNLRLDETLRLV